MEGPRDSKGKVQGGVQSGVQGGSEMSPSGFRGGSKEWDLMKSEEGVRGKEVKEGVKSSEKQNRKGPNFCFSVFGLGPKPSVIQYSCSPLEQ